MFKVGSVGRAHGLRGLFFVSGRNETLDKNLKRVFCGPSLEEAKEFLLSYISTHQNKIIIGCKEVTDRTAAEALHGQGLWVDRQEVSCDDTQEYFWKDLSGREVRWDKSQQPLGSIDHIYNVGASDIAHIISAENPEHFYDIPLVSYFFRMDFISNSREALLLSCEEDDVSELKQP